MWTSLIAYADYVWLAVRTNPEAKKHRGISMLIMPTTAEGFSWTPVHTMSGVDTSATYYQDVRVPTSALVGEENAGWKLVTNQLNHERVALVSAQPIYSALDGVREWAQNTKNVEVLQGEEHVATVLPDETIDIGGVAGAGEDASWVPDQETGVFVPADTGATHGPAGDAAAIPTAGGSVLDQSVFVREEEIEDVERPATDMANDNSKN
jgi:alkylation response protein AidB-like acyl-CoA dehydrogenase